MDKKNNIPLWLKAVLVAGLLLRLSALVGHPYPGGDVNLFCMAADNFSSTQKLSLQFKNHFTPELLPFGLDEPQSQHQPLWPLLGGIIKFLLRGMDSYPILQVLSLLSGLAVIYLVFRISRDRLPPWACFCAVTLTAGHPLLIEYSANGSFYMLLAVQWLLFYLLLEKISGELSPVIPLDEKTSSSSMNDKNQRSSFLRKQESSRVPNTSKTWISLGALLGFSILTHFTQVLLLPLIVMFFIWQRKQLKLSGLALSLLIAFLIWLPWGIRNQILFDSPFYSSTILNFKRKWGLLDIGIIQGQLVQIPLPLTTENRWLEVLWAWPLNTWQFLKITLMTTLFWPVLLLCYGFCHAIIKKQLKPAGVIVSALALLYLAQVSLWGFIRPRFIVPLLPLLFIGAAFSLVLLQKQLKNNKMSSPLIGVIVTVTTIISLFIFQPGSPFRQENIDERQQSHQLAEWLRLKFQGPVLGYATRLDGGIEAVRIHNMPYIHGRDFLFQPEATLQLLQDYQPKYLWCDERTLPFLQQIAPVQPIHREGFFFVAVIGGR